MIYVSSSCIKCENIKTVIERLAENGIYNIELSGGTKYYDGLIDDIFSLKEKYQLNLLIHNYFPPPKEDFVLNLASLNREIWEKSLNFFKKSIQLAIDLNSPVYGLHAGFFFDPSAKEIGKKISKQNLYNKEEGIKKFVEAYGLLKNEYGKKIKLYIENNVVSYENLQTFIENPFMLCTFKDYQDLKQQLDFNVLFDIGHLHVSSNTLNLDFEQEFHKFIHMSDYIHLSDNDGKRDQHKILNKDGQIYTLIKNIDFTSKIVSLEFADDINKIKSIYGEENYATT